jgi:hypothetical protein
MKAVWQAGDEDGKRAWGGDNRLFGQGSARRPGTNRESMSDSIPAEPFKKVALSLNTSTTSFEELLTEYRFPE